MSYTDEELAAILATQEAEEKRLAPSNSAVLETFAVPDRNWERIINSHNTLATDKFKLNAFECKTIVEWVKKGQFPKYVFKALGYTDYAYRTMVSGVESMEEKIEYLHSLSSITADQVKELTLLKGHPARLLMQDIRRAEGISALSDWELFNDKAQSQPDLLQAKMKAKYKDEFNNKADNDSGVNVNIQVGGSWINEL